MLDNSINLSERDGQTDKEEKNIHFVSFRVYSAYILLENVSERFFVSRRDRAASRREGFSFEEELDGALRCCMNFRGRGVADAYTGGPTEKFLLWTRH